MLAENGLNTEYCPRRFHAIIQRVRVNCRKSVTALIFKSGRVVLTGGTDERECQKGALRIRKRINFAVNNRLKYNAQRSKRRFKPYTFHVYRFKVENIVATLRLPYQLWIEKLASDYNTPKLEVNKQSGALNMKIRYNPLKFTGIGLHFAKKNGSKKCDVNKRPRMLAFINGKLIITGFNCKLKAQKFSHELIEQVLSHYDRRQRKIGRFYSKILFISNLRNVTNVIQVIFAEEIETFLFLKL